MHDDCGNYECEHSLCRMVRGLDEVAESSTLMQASAETFLTAQRQFFDDAAKLASLAAKVAWSLEADKGPDDDRVERQLLRHIEAMGMAKVVQQSVCAHDYDAGTCEHCGHWNEKAVDNA
jgi:hypothetical protein